MKETDLTKGKVISVITSLALPIMGSSFLQFTYNLIDMMWVGRLGSGAVASIGSSSLYINIGNAINSLVVIGTGIKVAHAIGRNDSNEVKEMVDKVLEKWGTIDILINNAGVSDNKSIYTQSDEDFSKIIDINVKAIFNCTKVVSEIMKNKKYGVILNTSSVVSLYGQKTGVGYPTSKFAVNGLTKSLARELGKDGIRVNAVAPGIIATDMVAALDKKLVEQIAQNVPLGRVGEPEDIANAFLFLASDMASYISGEILSVDGSVVL